MKQQQFRFIFFFITFEFNNSTERLNRHYIVYFYLITLNDFYDQIMDSILEKILNQTIT